MNEQPEIAPESARRTLDTAGEFLKPRLKRPCSRAGQAPQSVAESLILITSSCPRSTAGVQLMPVRLAGQFAHCPSRSTAKSLIAKPSPARDCHR
jgi:hypothetical protein